MKSRRLQCLLLTLTWNGVKREEKMIEKIIPLEDKTYQFHYSTRRSPIRLIESPPSPAICPGFKVLYHRTPFQDLSNTNEAGSIISLISVPVKQYLVTNHYLEWSFVIGCPPSRCFGVSLGTSR